MHTKSTGSFTKNEKYMIISLKLILRLAPHPNMHFVKEMYLYSYPQFTNHTKVGKIPNQWSRICCGKIAAF